MRGPSCWRISPTGAEMVWSLPIEDCGGICAIAPAIDGDHAYVPVKGGVACVELATGKRVGFVAGFSGAYAGYAMGDGLLFKVGRPFQAAKAFPEMKLLEGKLLLHGRRRARSTRLPRPMAASTGAANAASGVATSEKIHRPRRPSNSRRHATCRRSAPTRRSWPRSSPGRAGRPARQPPNICVCSAPKAHRR